MNILLCLCTLAVVHCESARLDDCHRTTAFKGHIHSPENSDGSLMVAHSGFNISLKDHLVTEKEIYGLYYILGNNCSHYGISDTAGCTNCWFCMRNMSNPECDVALEVVIILIITGVVASVTSLLIIGLCIRAYELRKEKTKHIKAHISLRGMRIDEEGDFIKSDNPIPNWKIKLLTIILCILSCKRVESCKTTTVIQDTKGSGSGALTTSIRSGSSACFMIKGELIEIKIDSIYCEKELNLLYNTCEWEMKTDYSDYCVNKCTRESCSRSNKVPSCFPFKSSESCDKGIYSRSNCVTVYKTGCGYLEQCIFTRWWIKCLTNKASVYKPLVVAERATVTMCVGKNCTRRDFKDEVQFELEGHVFRMMLSSGCSDMDRGYRVEVSDGSSYKCNSVSPRLSPRKYEVGDVQLVKVAGTDGKEAEKVLFDEAGIQCSAGNYFGHCRSSRSSLEMISSLCLRDERKVNNGTTSTLSYEGVVEVSVVNASRYLMTPAGKCTLSVVKTHGCLGCGDYSLVYISPTEVFRRGNMDISSDCFFKEENIDCQSKINVFKVKPGCVGTNFTINFAGGNVIVSMKGTHLLDPGNLYRDQSTITSQIPDAMSMIKERLGIAGLTITPFSFIAASVVIIFLCRRL